MFERVKRMLLSKGINYNKNLFVWNEDWCIVYRMYLGVDDYETRVFDLTTTEIVLK